MARPPVANEEDAVKTFIVKPGCIITDNNGVKRIGLGTLPGKADAKGNNLIELTYEQAKYFRALDQIEVPLEDFSGDNSEANIPKTSVGVKTDGSGEPSVGEPSSDPFASPD